MKSITKFLIALGCIGMLFACSKSDDNTVVASKMLKSSVTKSVSYYQVNQSWFTPVFCDGVQVDNLSGSGDTHAVDHFVDGVFQWRIITFRGVGKSTWTGETFTFNEQDKIFKSSPNIILSHTNLKGDKGTLYNISVAFNFSDWSFVIKNATCTGNSAY